MHLTSATGPRPNLARMAPPGAAGRAPSPRPNTPVDRVEWAAEVPPPTPGALRSASCALLAALALCGPLVGAASAASSAPPPAASQPVAPRPAPGTRVLDGTRGRIRSLRLQFPRGSRPEEVRARDAMVRDLLTRMDPSVRFEVVADGPEAARELARLVEEWGVPDPARVHVHVLSPEEVGAPDPRPMSMWSRDSAVALTAPDGRELLLVPRSFRGDEGKGDFADASARAPLALGRRHREVEVRRSSLDFEGGDLVANGRHLLVGETTIQDNMDALGLTFDQVTALFEAEMGREVLAISPAPDAHIDVGITLLDDRTAAVADPRLGLELLARDNRSEVIPADTLESMRRASADRTLQEGYDQAASLLESQGYRVVRLPYLAAGGVFSPEATWSNVLMERYADPSGREVRKVYMPSYGLPGLDSAARQTWQGAGFEVVDFPSAADATRLGGAVRCAVGEVDVEQDAAPPLSWPWARPRP